MIVESFNVVGALAALDAPYIETRMCLSIKPETTIFRFVNDTAPASVNGWDFEPAPYAEFSGINTQPGRAADSMTVVIDGRNLVSPLPVAPDQILHDIQSRSLRDRPVHVGLMVLDTSTHMPVGIISEFIGQVDNSKVKYGRDKGVFFEMKLVSARAVAHRRVAATYSNTGHQTRFPGDEALKWMADAVYRGGKYPWNSSAATAVSGGGGGRLTPDFIRTSLF